MLVMLSVRLLHGKPTVEKRLAFLAKRIATSSQRERELLKQLTEHNSCHSHAYRSETEKRIKRIKQLISEQETEPKKPHA